MTYLNDGSRNFVRLSACVSRCLTHASAHPVRSRLTVSLGSSVAYATSFVVDNLPIVLSSVGITDNKDSVKR